MKQYYQPGVLYLGASMIASAAGIGYDSRQKLWRRILGREPETPMNPAMQWGVDNEDNALAEYERLTGSLVIGQQEWHVHPTLSFIGSTLDGLTHDGLTTVEAKCPANLYAEPPLMYVAQCVTQRACACARDADLIAWTPVGSRIWRIGECAEFTGWLFAEAEEFWGYVTSDIEPPRRKKPTPPPIEFELIHDTANREAA